MKTISLIFLAFCCLSLAPFAAANEPQNNDKLNLVNNLSNQAKPDPAWFCDHWPEQCDEVCEIGSSPWGRTEICKLRSPWLPIPASVNIYNFAGSEHNRALENIGAQNSFSELDKKIVTTHMIQLTAEYLCKNGTTQEPTNTSEINVKSTSKTFKQTDNSCVHQYAGLETEVFNDLREVIYLDGTTDEIVNGYLEVFKSQEKLSSTQLREIEKLYNLLPSDDNINDLYTLFERIDEFDQFVSSELTEREAETVLLTSAVMRASLEYWLHQLDAPSNWFTLGTEIPSTEAALPGWLKKALKFVAADAAGCLGGSIILGVPGCIIGGAGASAGTASTF